MTKRSVVTLPNGTVIEISPDLSPSQITAMITALTTGGSKLPEKGTTEGATFIQERDIDMIWNSSKREKIALFIRTYFAENLWFSAKDVQEEQLSITGKLLLGETSAISTYLTRLFESGFVDRQKGGSRSIQYRMTEKLIDEYPLIQTTQLQELILNTID